MATSLKESLPKNHLLSDDAPFRTETRRFPDARLCPQAAERRGVSNDMRRCLLVLLLLLPVAAGAGSQLAGLEVMDVGGGARIVMEFDRPPKYRVLEFDSPPRLVMDFQDTRPAAGGPAIAARSALVRRVRHARRGDAGYRLVFDLAAPVGGAYSVRRPPRHPNRIVLSVRHPPGSGRKSAPSPAPARSSRAAPRGKPAPARDSQAAARKAVIVVDPGHGGKDPGATGVRGTHEKDIALAVSKRLAGMINREYGMTARLTRANDRFLSLRERVEFARRHRADLFISIHADAAPNAKVHGASVYVLSEKGASTEAARLLARRENAADLVGGVGLQDKNETLASILIDLSQTAAMDRSAELAAVLLRAFSGVTRSRRVEAAGFAVLKSPDTPSVLVELGYLSNRNEEARLKQTRHQRRLAASLLTGIRRYFAEHAAPGLLLAQVRVRDYTVARGDTLSEIALKFSADVEEIKRFSGLSSDRIRIGQKLKVPVRKK